MLAHSYGEFGIERTYNANHHHAICNDRLTVDICHFMKMFMGCSDY